MANANSFVTLVSVDFPQQMNSETSPFLPFGIAFVVIMGALTVLGLLTEHTHLFESGQTNIRSAEISESKSKVGQVFLCFSPTRNLQKFFKAPEDQDSDFRVLHGVKVVATISVVMVHYYFSMIDLPISNLDMDTIDLFFSRYWFTFAFSAIYAVDIFFFISAFLAGYLLLQRYQKEQKMNLLGLI